MRHRVLFLIGVAAMLLACSPWGDDTANGGLVNTRPASAVEAAYLTALAGATTWAAGEGGQLVLGGAVPLTFVRS